jgi:hypothetical protein
LSSLFDQQNKWQQFIGGTDKKISCQLQEVEKRRRDEKTMVENEKTRKRQHEEEQKEAQIICAEPDESTSMHSEPKKKQRNEDDQDYDPIGTDTGNKNYALLENLARACDRFGVSNAAGAYIANAVMKDVDMLTETNIIDRKKLGRQQTKYRKIEKEAEEKRQKKQPISGMYMDGRRDATLTWKVKNGKKRRKLKVEEHYSIVEEPESRYIGHVTPQDGTGLEVGKSLFRNLEKNNAVKSVKVIGGDGTNVNSGWKQGAMAYVEKFVGKPLQRAFCQLHANELPLRAGLKNYAGKTTGPDAFSGPLNKGIHDSDLTDRPIVKFQKIPTDGYECPDDVYKDLSTDQHYALNIGRGIISGIIDDDLAARQSGKMGHARWQTTASTFCRLFVSTKNPSKELIALINIIILWYFYIKSHPKLTDGPKNLFRMIELLRDLPPHDQKLLQKRIQHNAFFANAENVLLTMLVDEDTSIREKAVNRILGIRAPNSFPSSTDDFDKEESDADSDSDSDSEDEDKLEGSSESEADELGDKDDNITPMMHSVRPFKVPVLNFDAATYFDMISFEG